MRTFTLAAVLLALPLCGCVRAPPMPPPAPAPRFDAIAFFAGHTEGTGHLEKLLSGRKTTRVQSLGRIEGQTLVVDQTLTGGSGAPTHREWRIHQTGPGRYAGTLSNASGGEILGEVSGNRLHFAFRMKGGLTVEQWLTLAPDGRSAHNVMTATVMGLRVAALDEDIRKID